MTHLETEFQPGDIVRVACGVGPSYLARVMRYEDGLRAIAIDGTGLACHPRLHEKLNETWGWHWKWTLVREAKTL